MAVSRVFAFHNAVLKQAGSLHSLYSRKLADLRSIFSNSSVPVGEEVHHPIRPISPVPLVVMNRHQQQAIFPNPTAPDAHEEARSFAPPVVDVPGDNEELMDIREIFDLDRYEKDNEESNFDRTRGLY